MADPKYANLPGIAYDQPDIYETNDLPESDQYTDFGEVEEESREVERIHLNPEVASEKFRGKYLDGSKVDFSDAISKSRRKGYDALSLWELAPAGETETAFQKFLRLKCEIQELINDVQTKGIGDAGDPNISAEEILKQASGMQKQLLELRIDQAKPSSSDDSNLLKKRLNEKLGSMSQITEKTKSSGSGVSGDVIQYELCVSQGSAKSNQFNRIMELESRIKMLETVLGADQKDKLATVAIDPKNQNILGCMSILSTKLSLLEPTHIELIEARLSSVLQKVTKISEKKLDVQELERTLKLSDLYDLMEESSSTIQALPELTERLNSLRQLHEEASEVVKELAEIKSLQEAIATGSVENDKILKELQAVITETAKRSGAK